MESIEMREIDYALAVYEERNFSRAAERCYIAQPALSKAIRKLENKLGIVIFDRSSQPLKITREGNGIIEYLRRMRAMHMELEHYCSRLRSAENCDLVIASPTYFCTYVLPDFIRKFRQQHPDFNIRPVETNNAVMRECLQSDAADIGLTVELSDTTGLSVLPLIDERVILAVPASLPINERLSHLALKPEDLAVDRIDSSSVQAVNLRDFENESFVLLKPGNDMRDRALLLCRDAGFYPKVSMELDQMLSSYFAASAGAGITFVRSGIPFYTGNNESLVFYKLAHSETVRHIYLLRNSEKMLDDRQSLIVEGLKDYFTQKDK